MAKIDKLHQLIQSLDKIEKRFFKIYASTNKDGNYNYLMLFDAINSLKDYDEDKLKKKLHKNKKLVKYLPQNKKYLKDLILKSIRDLNEGETIEDQYLILMKEQDFLSRKNLFKEQWKKLQKAKLLTIEYELFDKHLEVLDIEIHFLNEKDLNKSIETYQHYKETKIELLKKIELQHKLISSKNLVFQYLSKYRNKISKENLAIVAKEVEQYKPIDIEKSDSFTIKMWYYNILSNYYLLAGNNEKQFEYQQKLVTLFDTHPQFKTSNTKRYLIIFFNYLGALFKLENYELLKEQLDKIALIKVNNLNDRGEFYQNHTLYNTLYAMNTGKLNEVMDQSEQVVVELNKFGDKINASSLLTIYYNYALIFFLAENFKVTIVWLNRIKNIKHNVREDIQAFAGVLSIVCHYELKNYLIIESLFRSINRSHNLSLIEKSICSTILKSANSANKNKGNWKQLQKEIEECQDRIVGKVLITLWLKSKIHKGKGVNDFYLQSLKK